MSKQIATQVQEACFYVRRKALENYEPIKRLVKERSKYKKGSRNYQRCAAAINIMFEAHKLHKKELIERASDKYGISVKWITKILETNRSWEDRKLQEYGVEI